MHGSLIAHGFHGTIHTLKNYFTPIFLVFNFSKNKLYLNELLVVAKIIYLKIILF